MNPHAAAVTLACLLALPAASLEAEPLTPAEKAMGWTMLFDGSSTDNFRAYGKDSFPGQGWVIDDGALKVIAGGGGGDIITKEQYGDFELSLEFKVAPGANSGIIFRASEQHAYPWMTGPEYQILDDAGGNQAADSKHALGALYDLIAAPADKPTRPAGEWNHARVRIDDNVLSHYLNGMKLLEIDLDSQEWRDLIAGSKFASMSGFGLEAKGHISLQDHGNDVWYRNIKVRDLDAEVPGRIQLFNGRSLRGWEFHSDQESADNPFSVQDGVLACAGQPIGYLQTEKEYDNFVLELEWRFEADPAKAGNSGVLVRKIGPDTVWPRCVEAQLQSGQAGEFWNIGEFAMKTDPQRTNGRNTKRLYTAERPLGEWNKYEIIVDGPHVVLFVNGVMTNRAWNVEEIAGRICLQSEGAPIYFRNIHLTPIDR